MSFDASTRTWCFPIELSSLIHRFDPLRSTLLKTSTVFRLPVPIICLSSSSSLYLFAATNIPRSLSLFYLPIPCVRVVIVSKLKMGMCFGKIKKTAGNKHAFHIALETGNVTKARRLLKDKLWTTNGVTYVDKEDIPASNYEKMHRMWTEKKKCNCGKFYSDGTKNFSKKHLMCGGAFWVHVFVEMSIANNSTANVEEMKELFAETYPHGNLSTESIEKQYQKIICNEHYLDENEQKEAAIIALWAMGRYETDIYGNIVTITPLAGIKNTISLQGNPERKLPPPLFTRGSEEQIGLHTDKKCNEGHGLIRFTTPSEYGCDLCGQGVPKDTVMYGCNECDYDICTSCEST